MKYLDNNVDRGAKGAVLISTIGLPPVVSKTVYTLTDFIITNRREFAQNVTVSNIFLTGCAHRRLERR